MITIDSCEFDYYSPRVIYQDRHGPLRTDQYVCHTCDNPYCTKDSPHFIGTCQDNVIDSVNKGRHSCFANVHLAYAGNRGRDKSNDKPQPKGVKRIPVAKDEVSKIKELRSLGVRWSEVKRLTGRSSLTITRVMRGEYDNRGF